MFAAGDKIVYPMHGAGMIKNIEKHDMNGSSVDYFVLHMVLGDMKVMIPIDNIERVGLRHVISEDDLADVESVLKARPENVMKSITWNRRFNIYLEKMKSGDVLEVAEVVRVLVVQEEAKKLSTGERRLLNTAKQNTTGN